MCGTLLSEGVKMLIQWVLSRQQRYCNRDYGGDDGHDKKSQFILCDGMKADFVI